MPRALRAALSALLAVTLLAAPPLSCYAYADEAGLVREVSGDELQGDQGYRRTGSGDEPREGGEEPQVGV